MDHIGTLQEAAMLKGRKPFDESHDRLPGFGLDLIVDNTTGTPDVANEIGEPPVDYAVGGQAFFENALATIIANLNAAVANDPDWVITGTNADASSVYRGARGGWGMVTAGAPADQVIIGPRSLGLLPAGRDRRLAVGFNTSRRPRFEFDIRVNGAVDGLILKVGLATAGASAIGGGPNPNEFGFRFEDGAGSNIVQAFSVSTGSATTRPTGIELVADATYRFIADVDINRVPRFYIASDDNLDDLDDEAIVANAAANFPALTANITLLPFVVIQQAGAGAVDIEWVDRRLGQWSLTL